jgi:hypothetical protein
MIVCEKCYQEKGPDQVIPATVYVVNQWLCVDHANKLKDVFTNFGVNG